MIESEFDIQKAKKYIRNAGIAGIITAAITLIWSIVGSLDTDFRLNYEMDLWGLIDVGIVLILSIATLKHYRFAVLTLLIYFVISKIIVILSGLMGFNLISILFIYFYYMGTVSAFKLHKYKLQSEDEMAQTRSKRSIGFYIGISLGSFLLLIFLLLALFGIYSPSTEVLPGKHVKKQYIDFAKEKELIESSDEILYWYSDGLFDFKDGFYFLTKEKIIMYCQDWEEEYYKIPLFTIDSIEFNKNDGNLEDSQIVLYLNDDSYYWFPLSSEYDGDDKFYIELKKHWKNSFYPKGIN